MYTRRSFSAFSAMAIPALRCYGLDSTVGGVRMGLQSASFSFTDMGLDAIIKIMSDVGLAEIDVMVEHVEHYLGAPGVQLPGAGRPGPWVRRAVPPSGAGTSAAGPAAAGPAAAGPGAAGRGGRDPAVREALRRWRLDVSLEKYREVGRKFSAAGLKFFSLNLSFAEDFTDEEIEKGMLMAKAIGTNIITASSAVSIFPRLKPFAEKHDVIVALHNHSLGPDDFRQVMSLSNNFRVNLDVGHFFASGHDPISYLKEHHSRITNIHVKDRKKNQGAEMPLGEGDTPLRETLLLVKREKYQFPVCIEYVGPAGPAIELARCLQYCKDVLTWA